VFADGWAPVHQLHLHGTQYGIYTGLLAVVLNLMVAVAGAALSSVRRRVTGLAATEPANGG